MVDLGKCGWHTLEKDVVLLGTVAHDDENQAGYYMVTMCENVNYTDVLVVFGIEPVVELYYGVVMLPMM